MFETSVASIRIWLGGARTRIQLADTRTTRGAEAEPAEDARRARASQGRRGRLLAAEAKAADPRRAAEAKAANDARRPLDSNWVRFAKNGVFVLFMFYA